MKLWIWTSALIEWELRKKKGKVRYKVISNCVRTSWAWPLYGHMTCSGLSLGSCDLPYMYIYLCGWENCSPSQNINFDTPHLLHNTTALWWLRGPNPMIGALGGTSHYTYDFWPLNCYAQCTHLFKECVNVTLWQLRCTQPVIPCLTSKVQMVEIHLPVPDSEGAPKVFVGDQERQIQHPLHHEGPETAAVSLLAFDTL